jgi:hypothetical protein
MQTGSSSETLIGWNRMEGARLWTQDRIRPATYMTYTRKRRCPVKKGSSLQNLERGGDGRGAPPPTVPLYLAADLCPHI